MFSQSQNSSSNAAWTVVASHRSCQGVRATAATSSIDPSNHNSRSTEPISPVETTPAQITIHFDASQPTSEQIQATLTLCLRLAFSCAEDTQSQESQQQHWDGLVRIFNVLNGCQSYFGVPALTTLHSAAVYISEFAESGFELEDEQVGEGPPADFTEFPSLDTGLEAEKTLIAAVLLARCVLEDRPITGASVNWMLRAFNVASLGITATQIAKRKDYLARSMDWRTILSPEELEGGLMTLQDEFDVCLHLENVPTLPECTICGAQ